jgi:hypothetical protein
MKAWISFLFWLAVWGWAVFGTMETHSWWWVGMYALACCLTANACMKILTRMERR